MKKINFILLALFLNAESLIFAAGEAEVLKVETNVAPKKGASPRKLASRQQKIQKEKAKQDANASKPAAPKAEAKKAYKGRKSSNPLSTEEMEYFLNANADTRLIKDREKTKQYVERRKVTKAKVAMLVAKNKSDSETAVKTDTMTKNADGQENPAFMEEDNTSVSNGAGHLPEVSLPPLQINSPARVSALDRMEDPSTDFVNPLVSVESLLVPASEVTPDQLRQIDAEFPDHDPVVEKPVEFIPVPAPVAVTAVAVETPEVINSVSTQAPVETPVQRAVPEAVIPVTEMVIEQPVAIEPVPAPAPIAVPAAVEPAPAPAQASVAEIPVVETIVQAPVAVEPINREVPAPAVPDTAAIDVQEQRDRHDRALPEEHREQAAQPRLSPEVQSQLINENIAGYKNAVKESLKANQLPVENTNDAIGKILKNDADVKAENQKLNANQQKQISKISKKLIALGITATAGVVTLIAYHIAKSKQVEKTAVSDKESKSEIKKAKVGSDSTK